MTCGATYRIDIAASHPGMVFVIGQPGGLEFRGIAEEQSEAALLSWSVRNGFGNLVAEGNLSANVDGALEAASLPIGYSEITFQIRRGTTILADRVISAARIPAPRGISEAHAEASYFGMGVYLNRPEPDELNIVAKLAALAGVRWAREDMAWPWLEPARGEFDFRRPDLDYDIARKHGIRLLGLIGYLPDWARTPGLAGNRPPQDIETWREFVHRTVGHYAGRIDHWEIWNEPDVGSPEKPFFFTGRADEYVPLLKDAYAEAKKANPNCKVLLGGLSLCLAENRSFARDAMELGAAEHIDLFNLHGYSGLSSELEQWSHVYTAGRGLACWDTEVGFPTHGQGHSETDQAALVIQVYIGRIAAGMDKVFLYNFRDDGTDPQEPEHHFGIIRRDLTPKPAYVAFSTMTHQLEGMRYIGNFGEAPIECYVFQEPGDLRDAAHPRHAVAVLWSHDGGALQVPGHSLFLTDMMGNRQVIHGSAGTIEIAAIDQPVFLSGDTIDRLADENVFSLSLREAPSLPSDIIRVQPGRAYGVQVVSPEWPDGRIRKVSVAAPEGWPLKTAYCHGLRGQIIAQLEVPSTAKHGEQGILRVSVPGAGERTLRLQIWNPMPIAKRIIEIEPGAVDRDLLATPELTLRLMNRSERDLRGRISLGLPGNLAAIPAEQPFQIGKAGNCDIAFTLGLAHGIPLEMFCPAHGNHYSIGAKLILDSGELVEQQFPLDMAICARAKSEPELDSDAGWDSAYPAYLCRADQVAWGQDQWAGPEDLSAEFALLYDEVNLYLCAIVRDDIVRPNPFGEAAWRGDANVQLLIDTDPSDNDRHEWSDDDYQFFFTFEESGRPRITPAVVPHPVEGITGRCKRIMGGYEIRVGIPLSNLPKLKAAPGMRFGIDLIVDDADRSPDHEKLIAWSGHNEAHRDPTRMRWMVFE